MALKWLETNSILCFSPLFLMDFSVLFYQNLLRKNYSVDFLSFLFNQYEKFAIPGHFIRLREKSYLFLYFGIHSNVVLVLYKSCILIVSVLFLRYHYRMITYFFCCKGQPTILFNSIPRIILTHNLFSRQTNLLSQLYFY